MAEEAKMEDVIRLFYKKGQKSLDLARQIVRQEKVGFKPLKEALEYFMDNWEDVLHPALVALACEAVGGNPDIATELSAALVLLAGAADVHDDIIDQSKTKSSKPTVYGKYGVDIAVLAGDVLLQKGAYVLHDACQKLVESKRHEILKIVEQAFLEVSSAEAQEREFRGRFDISEKEYFELVNNKVAAGEASAKIGAILGNGTKKEVEILGHYAKTFGVLMTLRDEFVDMFEPDELKNRFEKEYLPLPILLTFASVDRKEEIIRLLKRKLNEKIIEKILDDVLNSTETLMLKQKIREFTLQELLSINNLKYKQDLLNQIICGVSEGL